RGARRCRPRCLRGERRARGHAGRGAFANERSAREEQALAGQVRPRARAPLRGSRGARRGLARRIERHVGRVAVDACRTEDRGRDAVTDVATVQAWLDKIGFDVTTEESGTLRIVHRRARDHAPFYVQCAENWVMLSMLPLAPADAWKKADLGLRLLAA